MSDIPYNTLLRVPVNLLPDKDNQDTLDMNESYYDFTTTFAVQEEKTVR